METIDLGLLIKIGEPIIAVILTAFLSWWLKNKAQTEKIIRAKVKNENLSNALTSVSNLAYDATYRFYETMVKELKQAAKDGKLTREEAIKVKAYAVQSVYDMMGTDLRQALHDAGIGVTDFISETIENVIAGEKARGIFLSSEDLGKKRKKK